MGSLCSWRCECGPEQPPISESLVTVPVHCNQTNTRMTALLGRRLRPTRCWANWSRWPPPRHTARTQVGWTPRWLRPSRERGLISPLWPHRQCYKGVSGARSPCPSTQTGHGTPAAALDSLISNTLPGIPSVPASACLWLPARWWVGAGTEIGQGSGRAESGRQVSCLCQGAVTSAPVLRKEGAMIRKPACGGRRYSSGRATIPRPVAKQFSHHPGIAPEPHTANNLFPLVVNQVVSPRPRSDTLGRLTQHKNWASLHRKWEEEIARMSSTF